MVLVHGPRQCGKTTLAQMIGEREGYDYLSFYEGVIRAAAEADRVGFVDDLPAKVILDVVQRVPGRFLLTGSVNVLLLLRLADSLAGCMAVLRLHPLAQCELAQQASSFPDTLFAAAFRMQRGERLGRQLAELVAAGGYSTALARLAGRWRAA